MGCEFESHRGYIKTIMEMSDVLYETTTNFRNMSSTNIGFSTQAKSLIKDKK